MKLRHSIWVLFACVLVCVAPAQQQKVFVGSGGWGATSPYNALYGKGKLVEFSGRVIGVQREAPAQGMESGVALLVKAGNGGTAMVDLGPTWYVDRLQNKLKVRDRVKVEGSKVFWQGRSMILAQKVQKGNRVMYLRGEDGFPMWVAYRAHIEVVGSGRQQGIQTLNGTITAISTRPVGGEPSLILNVATNSGNQLINVGPVWFLGRQDMVLQVGNTIILEGIPQGGFFVPWNLRREYEFLILRNVNGVPVWEAFRPGGGR